jgi:hypothetical protein
MFDPDLYPTPPEVAATTLDQGPDDDDEPLDWDNHPSLSPAERNPSLR